MAELALYPFLLLEISSELGKGWSHSLSLGQCVWSLGIRAAGWYITCTKVL